MSAIPPYEEKVPYLVRLKENKLPDNLKTTIKRDFCGFLVNNANGNFYFELNGCRMLVIIPYSWVEFMAPAKIHYDKFMRGEL